MLFAIDDEFDSYTSAASLFSLQFEMYLTSKGKDQMSLYRMTTDADRLPRTSRHCALSWNARRHRLSLCAPRRGLAGCSRLQAPVFDGKRLYDAVCAIDTPQGTVSVPAGNFPAFRVAIRLFDHGKEITDTHLWLWIAKMRPTPCSSKRNPIRNLPD